MESYEFFAYFLLSCIALCTSKPTLKEAKQCKEPIGIQTGFLEDRDVKTSTAQKNFTISDAWCSTQNNDKQFFAADLGEDFLFTKIATQGKVDDRNRFVKSYELQFSSDNKEWKTYLSDGRPVLEGNKDTFTVKYHKLAPDTIGRYVKLVPKSWNNGICSRMELYGCAVDDLKKNQKKEKVKTPAQKPAAKNAAPDVKSVVPAAAPVVPDAVKSALEAVNDVPGAKISLPDNRDIVPDATNTQPEAAAVVPQNEVPGGKTEAPVAKSEVPVAKSEVPGAKSEVPVAKSEVPVPKNEIPKRDSEANWSFATIGNNQAAGADTSAADNADLLELSRQLGTPTKR